MITNYKDGHIRVAGQRITIKRGQCGWSEVKLSERWKWSRGKVRRFINELENDERITRETNNRTTILTICNYNKLQGNDTPDGTPDSTTDEHQTDIKRTLINKDNNNNNTGDVKREASKTVQLGKQIDKITGWDQDPNWFGDYSLITKWLDGGWCPDLDIIPTIKYIMSKRKHDPPQSLKYFERAIAQAHTNRFTPLPKGNPNEKYSYSSKGSYQPSKSELADQAVRNSVAKFCQPSQGEEHSPNDTPALRHEEPLRIDSNTA